MIVDLEAVQLTSPVVDNTPCDLWTIRRPRSNGNIVTFDSIVVDFVVRASYRRAEPLGFGMLPDIVARTSAEVRPTPAIRRL